MMGLKKNFPEGHVPTGAACLGAHQVWFCLYGDDKKRALFHNNTIIGIRPVRCWASYSTCLTFSALPWFSQTQDWLSVKNDPQNLNDRFNLGNKTLLLYLLLLLRISAFLLWFDIFTVFHEAVKLRQINALALLIVYFLSEFLYSQIFFIFNQSLANLLVVVWLVWRQTSG